jgi:cellulose synthase/poly-beta-1,6-N-acetylglucosamine synthase-like glycosyltransferase/peptidoglycan/xylan/chitin deacetylase (PgdA/CDA1 family)/spore germination protein YaaH
MHPSQIFFDSTGKRRRLMRRAGAGFALVCAAVTTVFAISLLVVPLLPKLPGLGLAHHAYIRAPSLPSLNPKVRLARLLLRRSREELWREIARSSKRTRDAAAPARQARTLAAGAPVVAGFYASWRQTGLQSLNANADHMTHLMPEWLHLDSIGAGLDTTDWNLKLTPKNADVVRIARDRGLRVYPIFNNAKNGVFLPERVHRLLASHVTQRKLAHEVTAWLKAEKFQGLNLDFENLSPEDYRKLPLFMDVLHHALEKEGMSLTADVEATNPKVPVGEIASRSEFVVLMSYGEHPPGGAPGPIASMGWYYELLTAALQKIPANKLVVGIGNYSFDWSADQPQARPMTFQQALVAARDFGPDENPEKTVDFDKDALNTTFNYHDDAGILHEVWMLDGISAYNQWKLARRDHVRGAALWVLGAEDPSVWTFLDHRTLSNASSEGLGSVRFPYEVESAGTGEVLSVKSTPHEGRRTFEVDSANGLLTDMDFQQFPSSFILQHEGFHKGYIALTLDDGPDGRYTPAILDVLKELGVHATFFVVGQNAESYPELVRRMYDEGHEIGNHTFTHPNMGTVSHRRALLEINTTQRAIESITGHSTTLFRAPYNADAEPSTSDELAPLLLADTLGYVTVGETLDPQDWALAMPGPGNTLVPRTAEDLANTIISQVNQYGNSANVVLLHNAGGDRSNTIEALRKVVPELKEAGYRFVTVSQLLGTTRDKVMPAVAPNQMPYVGFDRIAFASILTLENLLTLAFVLGVTLGIARALLMAPFAIASFRRDRKKRWNGEFQPKVSVLIAAYNEQPVITRTIQSVLDDGYPDLEIIVVDDGSIDGTGAEVERAFGWHPSVRLIRQSNAGKALALNHGLRESAGEVVICFDADTQIERGSIDALVRHFADPRVGAVAGNVKVGNRINILTRWQALEYITSQNLDRRVYALFNAVTVVPGAVGAWRREAVMNVGAYIPDTMAEDMDLTFRIRRAGWKIEAESHAIGFTEAPDTFPNLFKQRFRWAYGTLQCLCKHRGALFRHGWFGWMALPILWVFQVFFQILAPLVDLQMFYALGLFANSWLLRGVLNQDWQPLPHATHMLLTTGYFYAVFFGVELLVSFLAFRLDREKPRLLWWLFWQRFVYRQLMYAVLWKSLVTALQGARAGWGKTDRKGSVNALSAIRPEIEIA